MSFTPVLLDTQGPPTEFPQMNGPVNGIARSVGGDDYAWGDWNDFTNFLVYKRLAGAGPTGSWARQDFAHNPGNVQYAGATNLKLVAGTVSGSPQTLMLNDFTFASDSWTNVGYGGGVINGVSGSGISIQDIEFLSTGDLLVIYAKFPLGTTTLYWARFSAGSWASIDNIIRSGDFRTGDFSAFLGASDRLHILYKDSSVGDWHYVSWQSDTLSATQTVPITSGDDISNTNAPGRGVEFGGNIYFAMKYRTAAGLNYPIAVKGIGVVTPTLSIDNVDLTFDSVDDGGFADIYFDSGFMVMVWSYYNFTDHGNRVLYNINNGSGWSSSILWWDELTNPAPLPSGQSAFANQETDAGFASPFGWTIELLTTPEFSYSIYIMPAPSFLSPVKTLPEYIKRRNAPGH